MFQIEDNSGIFKSRKNKNKYCKKEKGEVRFEEPQ
jgi:hypothetical protein